MTTLSNDSTGLRPVPMSPAICGYVREDAWGILYCDFRQIRRQDICSKIWNICVHREKSFRGYSYNAVATAVAIFVAYIFLELSSPLIAVTELGLLVVSVCTGIIGTHYKNMQILADIRISELEASSWFSI